MLDLIICRKCHDRHSMNRWQIGEEELVWRTKVLACPYSLQGYYEATTDFSGPPPVFCPYKFEQAVSAGSVNIDKNS